MSSFKSEPKAHALYIPELLDLIGGLLDMTDWLALMRTCKSVFPMIASRVWREVEAQVIMDLIVESSHKEFGQSDISRSTMVLFQYVLVMLKTNLIVLQPRLQEESETVDFTRFDMYAPFIKQLRVYGRTARYFKGERRHICMRRAQEGVLLPNLTSVTLLTSDLIQDSAALFWLDLFLMPSLQELNVSAATKNNTAWVSYSVASDISKKLATACPAIERLEFYPRDISRGDRNASTDELLPFNPRNLGLCTQLRKITSTIYMLSDDGFATLGALPQLQSLSLHRCEEKLGQLQLTVLDNSFPSLIRLSLLEMHTTTLMAIMGVKQLTGNLRFLRISQIFPYSVRYNYELCHRRINQTLACIFEYTLRLKSLSYDATQRDNYSSRIALYGIDPYPFLQTMSRLQLHSVSLLGIQFGRGDWLQSVGMAFQQVTLFRMPNQSVGSNDLHWFANLPFLRQLELGYVSLSSPLPALHGSVNAPIERLDATVTTTRGFNTPVVSAEQAAR
ncbi:hypothetical protein FRC07_006459 [Ceratobasidium sp. 392]|nr:hypothetical protein FRC07_006459 [Ceratobasidium sp. 392]